MVHLCCFKHVSREQRVPCGNFLLNRRPPLCELDWSCGTGCLEDSELQITTGASEAQRGLLPQRLGGGVGVGALLHWVRLVYVSSECVGICTTW